MASGILNDNMEAWNAVGWLLAAGEGQLRLMSASPRMQREVLSHYVCASQEVHDCEGWKDGFQVRKFLEMIQGKSDCRTHFFLQFQDVLSGPEGTDLTANLQRLNHARDMFYKLGKNLVFCVTPEVKAMVRRNAPDFYDFVTPTIDFEDQLPKEGGKNAPTRMPDKSVGVAVDLDLTRPDDELLAQANELMEQGEELRKALRYRDALAVFNNAYKIRKKVLSDEHPDTGAVYFRIAYVYNDTGNYATAIDYAQKALEIREKILSPYSADTAASYNDIGALCASMGDYQAALEWYRKAREIREAVLGTKHPDTAMTYDNIGNVYHSMGDYQAALEWHQKAREIREAVLGKEHPDTATTYNNIGNVYHAMGDYQGDSGQEG